jgi:hypothetical protein
MREEPPDWQPHAPEAQVLMEYLKRASPQWVASELEQLGLLQTADVLTDEVLDKVSRQALPESERDQLDRQFDAMLEQHGIRLADEAFATHGWRQHLAALRIAAVPVAMCALIGIVWGVDARWVMPLERVVTPSAVVRERVFKQYTVQHSPLLDGARHGVDAAALRELGKAMRERGIDAGASVALEYEVLLEPATGQARYAGLISAQLDGRDLQLAEYAAGLGLRVKEGL